MSQRGMPKRFLENAPKIINEKIIDIIEVNQECAQYEIILREENENEMMGLCIRSYGILGEHFHLSSSEMRQYRAKNRKNRVRWSNIPAKSQNAILDYLKRSN